MYIEQIDEIVEDSFGLWIDGLFGSISTWNPDISTFQEHKEAFFWLVEHLLRTGKIKFFTPNELWRGGDDIWDADVPTIIKYLRSCWPVGADSKNSVDLVYYFFLISPS